MAAAAAIATAASTAHKAATFRTILSTFATFIVNHPGRGTKIRSLKFTAIFLKGKGKNGKYSINKHFGIPYFLPRGLTMPDSSSPLVGILMGSQSDWETMKNAAHMLEQLGIPHEAKVLSAHRTP